MRDITTTIYQFDELTDAAKETAREWYRSVDEMDTEFLYDDFEAVAAILGIEFKSRPVKLMGGGTRHEPCIWWSGFSSQGDGACFEGRYTYAKGAPKAIRAYAGKDEVLHAIADDLQALQRKHFYRLAATCAHRGHYFHSGCMDVDVWNAATGESLDYEKTDAENELRTILRRFADWIYRQLEAEDEYRSSDEAVDEAIHANEYEFTEDGDRA